jgi:hypothetical protein
MIRAHHIGQSSAFLGQTCALCKQEFVAGDQIIVCPEDGSRHHSGCWQANGNKCTAYGCTGEGAIGAQALLRPRSSASRERPVSRPRVITQEPERSRAGAARPVPNAPGSKVRTLPAGGVGCAQTCLLFAIAIAIVLFALGCYGLWAIADYLMLQVWELPYRAPLSPGFIPTLIFASARFPL